MKSKTFMINIGLVALFYLLGTSLVVILLDVYGFTLHEISYILIIMAFISVLLSIYYMKRRICLDCHTLNYTIVVILLLMASLLLVTALSFL